MYKTNQVIISVVVILLVVTGLYFFLNPRAEKNKLEDVDKIPIAMSPEDSKVATTTPVVSSSTPVTATSTPGQTNNSTPKTMTTKDGLEITIEREGTGPEAKAGDTVSVNYLGTLTNGTKFDSSYDRNQPFSFQLGAQEVIQGWDEGVAGMKVGEKRKLVIPSALGYGARGAGQSIPPNSVLVFEVEMMKIN
jgi:FKBP-type peptidyl-prolyl cis-trans isomerase